MTPLVYDYNKLFSFLLGLVIAYLFFLVYRERKCICVCEKKMTKFNTLFLFYFYLCFVYK